MSSQKILNLLEIPQRSRRAPVYWRVAKLMTQLGWSAIRVRLPDAVRFRASLLNLTRGNAVFQPTNKVNGI
jgi:hypothetical protein